MTGIKEKIEGISPPIEWLEQKLSDGVEEVTTDHLGSNSTPASFVIWTDGTTTYADAQKPSLNSSSGTDDASVIQSAIDDMEVIGGSPNKRGSLFIRRGVYNISSTIQLKNRMMIAGEGRGSTLINDVGSGNPCISLPGTSGDRIYDIAIRDVNFQVGGSPGDQHIFVEYGTNIWIEDCYLLEAVGEAGLRMDNTNFSTVRNCSVELSGLYGVYLVASDQIRLENLGVKSNSSEGLRMESCQNCYVNGGLYWDNSNNGIIAISWSSLGHLGIFNTLVYSNQEDGIHLDGITNTLVSGNQAHNDGTGKTQENGIVEVSNASTSDYNLISANDVRTNNSSGISTVGTNTVTANNIT